MSDTPVALLDVSLDALRQALGLPDTIAVTDVECDRHRHPPLARVRIEGSTLPKVLVGTAIPVVTLQDVIREALDAPASEHDQPITT